MAKLVCFTGNFLLLATFIISLIAIFFNMHAINGHNWRYIAGRNTSKLIFETTKNFGFKLYVFLLIFDSIHKIRLRFSEYNKFKIS